ISAATPSPTGLSDEFSAFASLSIPSAGPKSRRLARWTQVVIRTSSFFWSADGEGLHAKSQPDCQGDYVVCGSDVFRGCPKPGCVLGLALGRSWEQAVFSICARMGGGNVGK